MTDWGIGVANINVWLRSLDLKEAG